MAEIVVKEVAGVNELAAVRELMRGYGEYLAANPHGAANICLERYAQELEGLPGPYLVLLLAEVDGEPAGCVALKLVDSSAVAEAKACEMKRLWVEADFRGYRLGRRLVEEAIAWARRQGFEAMYLDTVPAAMPEANRIYESLGFERVERYNKNPVPGLAFFRISLG